MKLTRTKAFTLAETLITLGIIGVVAAITIPNLITNYKAKQLRSQFLRAYSLTQQAFKLMEEDDVSLDPSTYTTQNFSGAFRRYFTGSMQCHGRHEKPCYHMNENASDTYKTYNKAANFASYLFDDGQFALADGTLFLIENPSSSTDIFITVDINGTANKPNRAGYDLFTFQFTDGKLNTMGSKGTRYIGEPYCNENSTSKLNGISCAHEAKENPDYFKRVLRK